MTPKESELFGTVWRRGFVPPGRGRARHHMSKDGDTALEVCLEGIRN